jgi:hypothetical protein
MLEDVMFKYRLLLAGFSLTIFLFAFTVVHAATLSVNSTDDTTAVDTDCTLREAIANVNDAAAGTAITYTECGEPDSSDNEITLSDGTYCASSAFSINASVTITGEGTGTIIDAGNSAADCTASSDKVMGIDTQELTVSLSNLTIMGGAIDGHGSGLYVTEETTLSLDTVVIKDNAGSSSTSMVLGGGLFIDDESHVTITDSTISGNTITVSGASAAKFGKGAGMYFYGETLSISGSTIEGNSITSGFADASGAGLYLSADSSWDSSVTIEDTSISNNYLSHTTTSIYADAQGAGISIKGIKEVSLSGLTFEVNTITSDGRSSDGGGLHIYGGISSTALNIQNTIFSENEAVNTGTDYEARGGGLYISDIIESNIENSLFYANEANHEGSSFLSSNAYGGAIFIQADTTNLTNVTLSANKAQGQDVSFGGAIFAYDEAVVNIAHSTITNNEASGGIAAYGGGLSRIPPSSSTEEKFNLINTILTDNSVSGTTTTGPDCYETIYTYGNNLVSDVTDCTLDDSAASGTVTDYTGTSAAVTALAENGGSTQTHAINSGDALNNGNCLNVAGDAVTTDGRGATRGSSSCDIGAYEVDATEGCDDDLDNDGDGDEDCDDDDCSEDEACEIDTAMELKCNDDVDNDEDGDTDCDDSDCDEDENCEDDEENDCDDEEDNDGDGDTDCDDSDCDDDSDCMENDCDDDEDNDDDGDTDCDDSDCEDDSDCMENDCDDDEDNDDDGDTDCDDSDCKDDDDCDSGSGTSNISASPNESSSFAETHSSCSCSFGGKPPANRNGLWLVMALLGLVMGYRMRLYIRGKV